MRKNLILIFMSLCFGKIYAQSLDSLLKVLDGEIKNDTFYVSNKLKDINDIKYKIQKCDIKSDIIKLNFDLYREYRAFICDSALTYLDKCMQLAEYESDTYWINKCRIEKIYDFASSGMYEEAQSHLSMINEAELTPELKFLYYLSVEKMYEEMRLYTQNKNKLREYSSRAENMRDSLLKYVNPNDDFALEINQLTKMSQGENEEALEISNERFQKINSRDRKYSIMCFERALVERNMNNRDAEMKYLALSAITDIRSAVKDNASLHMLALKLYEEEDNIDRAYSYIKFALNDANFYNARLRNIQISNTLPIIEQQYQIKKSKHEKAQKLFIIIVSSLVFLLVILLLFIIKQMQKLSRIKINLQKSNNLLTESNTKLEDINNELCVVNHIKEEYIALFFGLSSSYLDKLDSHRNIVVKMLTQGKTKELLQLNKSREELDKEEQQFYKVFDETFLNIFPTFVEELNQLIKEEDKYEVSATKELNIELRIFALMRLGITHSSQIAAYLRYSVNTIYNYRAKMKSKLAVDKDNFEKNISKIGNYKIEKSIN